MHLVQKPERYKAFVAPNSRRLKRRSPNRKTEQEQQETFPLLNPGCNPNVEYPCYVVQHMGIGSLTGCKGGCG